MQTYQLENELMWHESLRSVSFNLLKSCNLNTHGEQFLSSGIKADCIVVDWIGGISIGQMGQLVRFLAIQLTYLRGKSEYTVVLDSDLN